MFDTTKLIVIGHKCKMCSALKKKLSKLDKKIVAGLEKSKGISYNYEKILRGVDFK
ncbi:MAG: hypothetical protein HY376_03195 [Candidatus Blackburnbacteria bacterium]|nr:hypothetical protein [Candidatus Blackburnbacteria bacterium]